MEYTDPKQGITVSAPKGLTCAEINQGLRGLIDENEQLLTGQRSAQRVEDKIGQAAQMSRSVEGPALEYVISDQVDQMALLYAILLELRKIAPSESSRLDLKTAVAAAGWDAFNSGPGSNLQRMGRAYAAMKAAERT